MKSLFQLLAISLALVTLFFTGQNRELRGDIARLSQDRSLLTEKLEQTESLLEESRKSARSLQDNLTALQARADSSDAITTHVTDSSLKEAENVEGAERSPSQDNPAIELRVQALTNLVDISPQETERLRQKFENEAQGLPSESLEEVIGEDLANFVREQRKRSFEQSAREAIEKEAYFFSRRFAMSPEQERLTFIALEGVESEIEQWRKDRSQGLTPRERMFLFVEESRMRRRLTRAQMQAILDGKQFEQYTQYDADSVAADVELWHGGAEEK